MSLSKTHYLLPSTSLTHGDLSQQDWKIAFSKLIVAIQVSISLCHFQTSRKSTGPLEVKCHIKHSLDENTNFDSFVKVTLYILCTISLAILYVLHLFCAHLRAVPINFNCNDETRILGKWNHEISDAKIDFVMIWLMFFLQVTEAIGLLAVHSDDKEPCNTVLLNLKWDTVTVFCCFLLNFQVFEVTKHRKFVLA